MAAEEAELMARYCDGDKGAFDELYGRIAPRLSAYLARLSGNRALADDLLQQTFMKVHRARSAYIRGAAPLPWLYAIAHRTFLDEARRQKRSKLVPSKPDDSVPEIRAHISGKAENEVDAPQDPELLRAVMAALQDLPQTQREALVLTKLQGKTLAEAAEIVGTTPGAMKLRAHRGYVALRKAMSAAGIVEGAA